MNSCSVRDLLRLALPPGTQLLTPELGLKHTINRVASLRSTLPALPALHGGELVLLSVREALALDERLTLRNIVGRLGDVRVAAVAYAGPRDAEATTAAAALGLSLLQLPDGVNPRAVERDVLHLLDNRDLQLERRAAQLYHALTQQVAGDEGIEALLKTLQKATGREIAFYGAASDLRHHLRGQPGAAILHDLPPRDFADLTPNGHPFIVRRIGRGESMLGYIALAGPALDHWDDAAVSQTAAALLLELAKQQAVRSAEARVGGELLHSIVGGKPADMVTVQEQAAELGYDLRSPHVAVLVASADRAVDADTLRDQLENTLGRDRIIAPHVLVDDVVLCLLPTDPRLEQPWKLVHTLAAELPISAGISQVAPTATSWQRAYGEAREALTLGQHLFGPRSLTAFRDLQVYRLLVELRSSSELWSFYHATLSPLIDYDRVHHAALLDTLEAYFATQGNLREASDRLNIHRNTLLYRLRRIGELCGIDVECSDDMLALQIALKAHRVFSAPVSLPEAPALA